MLRTRHARHRELISVRNPCVHWFVGAVLAGISGLMLATNADAESNAVEFNIPAQPVPSALRVYAQQAAVQLLASTQGLDAVQANAVVGRFDSQTALQMLLAGTGLLAEYRADATIVIKRSTEASVPPAGSMDSEALSYLHAQANVEADQQIIDVGTSETRRNSTSEDAVKALEEIVVTGTQIRGTAPVGASVITFDREYIEVSGLATTQEVLQSVPQNFGGGSNEDTRAVGIGGGTGNVGFSSSVNLRGLGTESTLLLLNGRRSAAGGGNGNFVDLNSIPAVAIERIEILPDGASAIYGSDAIGGVVNVILRDNFDGAETRFRYAPGTSDIDEFQFSQVLGKSWNSGNALFTYEYYDRSELKSEDRVYTSNSDLTSLGGTNHDSPTSNPGNIDRYTLADGSSMNVTFAIPSGQDGTTLVPADLLPSVTNLQNTREGTTVLPSQERHSASLMVSQVLSNNVDLFADLRYSSREFEHRNSMLTTTRLVVPSTNPFFVDPFGGSQSLRIQYSPVDDYGPTRSSGTVDTLSGTIGATFSVSNSWELEAYSSYNAEDTSSLGDRRLNTALVAVALADPDPATAFNPFGDGSHTNPATLADVEGFIDAKYESELTVFNVRADGSLFDMPGGAAKLAIGAQYRDDSIIRNQTEFTSTPAPVASITDFDLRRDVTAVFAELYLPLVTKQNNRPGIRNLAVSIAARYEDYSDFGDTFDPKLGVSWSPKDSVTLRSTVGTSFRAPLLIELDDQSRLIFFIAAPDPASPTGETNTLYILGNSPTLEPQEGTSWTAGFDVTPVSLPGFKVGLTYFATEVDKLIQLPGNNLLLPFQEPDIFASIVTLNPDVGTVTALLNEPVCFCDIAADEVEAVIDFRNGNLAKAELSGVDLNLSYAFDTEIGSFDLYFYASHLFEFKEQLANGPLLDNVDIIGKPTSLTLRSRLAWTNGGANANVFVNHIGNYTDNFSDPNVPVGSWTTLDLNLGYDFGERYSGFLEGTKVSLSVQNIFDTDPPFVDSSGGFGFDSNNANAMGRFLALQLSKEW